MATEDIDDRVSRLRYSSPVDQQEWTLSPGGFSDIVDGGSRMITGLERLGRVYCIHYHDTIVVGQPTGQDDPPLAFDSSRATVGAAYTRTIRNVRGTQWFVAQDGSVHSFDGSSTQMIASEFRREFRLANQGNSGQTYIEPMLCGAWLNQLRDDYCFCYTNQGNLNRCNLVGVVNYEDGTVRRESYEVEGDQGEQLSGPMCGSDEFLGFFRPFADGTALGAEHFVGTRAEHPGGGVSGEDMYRYLAERGNDDEIPDPGPLEPTNPIILRTLPLDFGYPGEYKTIERVILYMGRELDGAGPNNDMVTVRISKNGDTTAQQIRSQLCVYDAAAGSGLDQQPGAVRAFHFEFDQTTAAEAWDLAIEVNQSLADRYDMSGYIEKIVVRFAVLGEDEAAFVEPG